MAAFDGKNRNYLVAGVVIVIVIFALIFLGKVKLGPSEPTGPAANVSQELPRVNPSIAQALTPGQCPANQCRNWIFGSCSKKQLYKERECFRYGAFPDCPEETYYESHTESVDACGQSECQAGKTFFNYTCV